MDQIDTINKLIYDNVIEDQMTTKFFGKKVVHYEEVDSTNTVAKRLGKEPGNHGVLVLANSQSAGRGRLGREWDSPKNEGIWMSLILKPQINIRNASMITLIAALAVNKGIKDITGLNSSIKWPNDIVINGKKACGILTEMSTSKDILECIVVGIGINVSNEIFDEEIKEKATSLLEEGYTQIDKAKLINKIMMNMEHYYEVFLKTESLKALTNEYNESLINMNRTVKIIESENEWSGVALGINDVGELLIRTEVIMNGLKHETVKAVVSGEVSVRGIYGYV